MEKKISIDPSLKKHAETMVEAAWGIVEYHQENVEFNKMVKRLYVGKVSEEFEKYAELQLIHTKALASYYQTLAQRLRKLVNETLNLDLELSLNIQRSMRAYQGKMINEQAEAKAAEALVVEKAKGYNG